MTHEDAAVQLDVLVTRLERAAEQLRSGDLSPDAAAGLVEDAASLASQASAELERLSRAAAAEPIPAEGAIDEAVETAKAFCGPDAPGFVNGILGAALAAVRENGANHG